MRAGAEFFTQPSGSAQRRYEAMRAYFVEDWPATRVADQFGYSTASVHQMATLVRSGRMRLFADARPGPKGPVKATGPLREKVISLRARRLSVTQIARILTEQGTPVSAQTVWKICDAGGMPRLHADDATARGPASRLTPVKAAARDGWQAQPLDLHCDHAGLLLLAPAMTELGLHELIAGCGYPATTQLSAWHSTGTLLLAACNRVGRAHHIDTITDDAGLAFFLGLTALPKATRLSTYSCRVRRESSQKLLTGLVRRLRPLAWPRARKASTWTSTPSATTAMTRSWKSTTCRPGPSAPAACSRSSPATTPPTRWSTPTPTSPRPSRPARSSPSPTTGTTPPGTTPACSSSTPSSPPIKHWKNSAAGASPGSPSPARQGRTHPPGHPAASAWKHHTIDRAGRYRHPRLHEDTVTLKGISAPTRQIAIKNIGRDEPTLLITNDHPAPAKDLFARYAERMLIENELDACISGFSLNALSSAVSLNVDLDTTLTVVAGNLTACSPTTCPATPEPPPTPSGGTRNDTGTLKITPGSVTADLTLRSHHPSSSMPASPTSNSPSLVGRPAPALPLPTPLTTGESSKCQDRHAGYEPRTSTEFLHRESRLTNLTT